MELVQNPNQAVNVTNWRRDEEFAQYPEGARDKTLLYCPEPAPYDFLKANHPYLFKRSSDHYPEQFLVEILAYRLGSAMDIPVPPTFFAYDTKECQSAALIEWYLSPSTERSTPGGDYCQQYIPDFDRKRGKKHNFETIIQIFKELKSQSIVELHWEEYWAKAFLFDALIGNTDRHQDNWCVIEAQESQGKKLRMCPVFDNGSSMGHKISNSDFSKFTDLKYIERYVSKGCHHMRWALNDEHRMRHCQMLIHFLKIYPKYRKTMLGCLKKVNENTFKRILDDLVGFDATDKLTSERAAFMLNLLKYRHQRLLKALER